MVEFFKNPAVFQYLSIAGTLSAILGSIISAAAYRGKLGEPYSPFNHFVSELGETGVSRLAWVFNLGLTLCGLCLLPACISLGLILDGVWSKLGMAAGAVAAISLALVGIFPMNKLTPHIRAAVMYFRLGLVMVFCFTLAIAFPPAASPVLPRQLGLAGIPAVLAFTYFLLFSRIRYNTPEDSLSPLEMERPRIWGTAVAEWAIFLTTVPWFLAIALGL